MTCRVAAARLLGTSKAAATEHVEWKAIQLGMAVNVTGAIFFGWLAVSICQDDEVSIWDSQWNRSSVSADDTEAIAKANFSLAFDRFDAQQTMERVASGMQCESWHILPAVATALCQFFMGSGASLAMVASTTYLALARPNTRSSGEPV